MHQLVSQKSSQKEHNHLGKFVPDQDLLLHKTMPSSALYVFHEVASTSKQTPSAQNASEIQDFHSNNAGGFSERAASTLNRLSNVGLPHQHDLERIRSKLNRDFVDHHHTTASKNLARENLIESRTNLHQPVTNSTLSKGKKITQTLDPSKFIDVDRLPSNYSQPFITQQRDPLKNRQTSFLSDNISSNKLAFSGAPRSSQTSHKEDSPKDEDLVIKNSTDSNNHQRAEFSHGKNSGIVLVEVHDQQIALADRHNEVIHIEEARPLCSSDKLTKLLLHSEIRKTEQEIDDCHSTLRDLKQVYERVKRASEELIRGRQQEIKSLESKFERELNSLHQQLQYETSEYKLLWKKVMDS